MQIAQVTTLLLQPKEVRTSYILWMSWELWPLSREWTGNDKVCIGPSNTGVLRCLSWEVSWKLWKMILCLGLKIHRGLSTLDMLWITPGLWTHGLEMVIVLFRPQNTQQNVVLIVFNLLWLICNCRTGDISMN